MIVNGVEVPRKAVAIADDYVNGRRGKFSAVEVKASLRKIRGSHRYADEFVRRYLQGARKRGLVHVVNGKDWQSLVKNPNHPKAGVSIKAEPIRCLDAIKAIKREVKGEPRNHALFVLGINTPFSPSELLSVRVGEVENLKPGESIRLSNGGSNRGREVELNATCHRALRGQINALGRKAVEDKDLSWVDEEAYLFSGRRPESPILVSTMNNLVKKWCSSAGLKGNYGSHSLRKTWGYMHIELKDTAVGLITQAFGQTTSKQTLSYLCLEDQELKVRASTLNL